VESRKRKTSLILVCAEFFSTIGAGRVSRKGSTQRENVHIATAARNLYATRREDGADATVLRTKDRASRTRR